MLPTELLIYRQTGEEIIPKRLKLDDKHLALANDLINFFQDALGKNQGYLERQLIDFEGETTDYRMKRGLGYILKSSFCTFEIISPLEPQVLREKVFTLAAQSVASPQNTDIIFSQNATTITDPTNRLVS